MLYSCAIAYGAYMYLYEKNAGIVVYMYIQMRMRSIVCCAVVHAGTFSYHISCKSISITVLYIYENGCNAPSPPMRRREFRHAGGESVASSTSTYLLTFTDETMMDIRNSGEYSNDRCQERLCSRASIAVASYCVHERFVLSDS